MHNTKDSALKSASGKIYYYWRIYTHYIENEIRDTPFLKNCLTSINKEIDAITKYRGCLERLFYYIKKNATLYKNSDELLHYMSIYCAKHGYLAPTFCARFKRNPITNNERKK